MDGETAAGFIITLVDCKHNPVHRHSKLKERQREREKSEERKRGRDRRGKGYIVTYLDCLAHLLRFRKIYLDVPTSLLSGAQREQVGGSCEDRPKTKKLNLTPAQTGSSGPGLHVNNAIQPYLR